MAAAVSRRAAGVLGSRALGFITLLKARAGVGMGTGSRVGQGAARGGTEPAPT
jgi:hypothetical protein